MERFYVFLNVILLLFVNHLKDLFCDLQPAWRLVFSLHPLNNGRINVLSLTSWRRKEPGISNHDIAYAVPTWFGPCMSRVNRSHTTITHSLREWLRHWCKVSQNTYAPIPMLAAVYTVRWLSQWYMKHHLSFVVHQIDTMDAAHVNKPMGWLHFNSVYKYKLLLLYRGNYNNCMVEIYWLKPVR